MIQSHSTSITYYQYLLPTTRTTVVLMTMIQSHSTSITYYQYLLPTTRTTVVLMTMMWTTMSGLTIRWIGFQDHTQRVHGCLVPCAIGRPTQKVSDRNFFK